MSRDYKKTVFLPETDFPMRGGLPQKEPELLARWQKMDLYQRLRDRRQGCEKFVLHAGPPFANGDIHMGHALTFVLKDVVVRCWSMLGYDTPYVPGSDCHGLPIEWKIEEKYRKAGKQKDEVPILDFRAECRAFAAHWSAVQNEQFQRLGLIGDWKNQYSTMTNEAEACIVAEVHKFLLNGGLYRGKKPVMWSVVEKTALADAEMEYRDHVSTTVWVKFPVVKASVPALDGAAIVIWTTTPWTLPGNRAIACGDFDYAVIATEKFGRIAVAQALLQNFAKDVGIDSYQTLATLKGGDIAGTLCAHPLRGQGYEFDVPVLNGDFVTTETGTGFVHIAPGHGEDDFYLGMNHGIEVPDTVANDGVYLPHVPLFGGLAVYRPDGKGGPANKAVMEKIDEAGHLLGSSKLTHSYPHSWRSNAPLIFLTTPQLFFSMETNNLRAKALEAIGKTKWVPAQRENRIRSMVENRPDWCASRQRTWGVPIAIFIHKKTGELLRDEKVCGRIFDLFMKEGSDAWFAHPASDFLGKDYNPDDYEQVKDVVDVWFESGTTHAFVLEQRPELHWPADLYLEGSDQHRGWFQSSLLEACGTRGSAPYKAVLTNGFVVDAEGRKMSKSAGNGVDPRDVSNQMGADILRLWVMNSDYTEDIRVGAENLKHMGDLYRRLRNTLRYLLGALAGFDPAEKVPAAEMPELERWVLHRLSEVDAEMKQHIRDYKFTALLPLLHNFCAIDLSAFYFDVRKDSLYCDDPGNMTRRACRTAMNILFDCLTAWLAPFICFTAEEAWLTRNKGDAESVHLRTFPELPQDWRDDELAAKWDRLRDLRRVVTGAIEVKRASKDLGSSLQAAPTLYCSDEQAELLRTVDFADICITSSLKIETGAVPEGAFALPDVPGCGAVVAAAEGRKCERCWKILGEVGRKASHPDLCLRCAEAVDQLDREAA